MPASEGDQPQIFVGFINVELWHEIIGEPEHAQWCGTCLLPSGVKFKMAVGTGDQILVACEHFACQECGRAVHLRHIGPDDLSGTEIEPSAKERNG